MTRPRCTGEEGSVLVMALAFLLILSVSVGAVIVYGTSGVKTSVAVRAQRNDVYAADGAMEAEIKKLEASNGDCATTLTTLPLNGRSVSLTCSAVGSGVGTVNPQNRPGRAILTLGTSVPPDGLDLNHDQTVIGGVYSHSDINVRSGTLTVQGGDAIATTGCLPSPNSVSFQPPFGRNCNFPGGDPTANDPGYHPRIATPPADSASVSSPPTCTKVVRFFPGRYPNPNALNAITNGGCNNDVWLTPGVYYFDFPAGNSTWTIKKSGGIRVVAGEQSGWYINDATSPSGLTVPGGCVTEATNPNTDGVQFIFGGESHIDMQGGKLEVCPKATQTEQEIAIYGTGGVGPAAPGYSSPSGCVVTVTCPLISATSTNSEIYVRGTVYAPAALIDVQAPNNASVSFVGRGVIAKYLKINLPSSNPNKISVQIPPFTGSGPGGPYNELVLTASINSRPRLRAKVHFEGNVATVLDWSVLR